MTAHYLHWRCTSIQTTHACVAFAGHTDAARADQSGSGSAAVLGYGGLLSGMMAAGTS